MSGERSTVGAAGRRRLVGLGVLGALVLAGSGVALASRGDDGPAAVPTAPVAGRRPDPASLLLSIGDGAELLTALKASALPRVHAGGVHAVHQFGGGRERFNAVGAQIEGVAMLSSAAGGTTSGGDGDGGSVDVSSESAGRADMAATFSGTNNQERDVDEADDVKTDGDTLFSVGGDRRRRVDVVDVASATPKLLTSVRFEDEEIDGLLLHRDRLLVFTTVVPSPAPGQPQVFMPELGSGKSRVHTIDVAAPDQPRTVATADVDGAYVDARLVDGRARLVSVSGPQLAFVTPTDQSGEAYQRAVDENRRLVEDSTLADWMPDGATASRTYRAQSAQTSSLVSVRTVNPTTALVGDAVTVAADPQVVYASAASLYLATPIVSPDGMLVRTSIHKLDITDPASARYVGSGDVPGVALNQFALSEEGDALRIATTDTGVIEGQWREESAVTVLRPSEGALVEVGRVGGLGKGERIQSVRFVGDRGYVVTFRQVDPLYVLDLADPAAPALRGELKIPGYSAYLHPVGPHQLLGVGVAASDQGQRTGFQISLFDVADPASPKQLSTRTIENGSSTVEQDHHAFLWWAPTGLALVPVHSFDPQANEQRNEVVGYGVSATAVDERGRVSHPARVDPMYGDRPFSPGIQRSLIARGRILTISVDGILSSDLTTLRAGAFTPLPKDPQPSDAGVIHPGPVVIG